MYQKHIGFNITVAALAIILYLIPSPIDPEPYFFEDALPKLEGALSRNHILQKAIHLHEGKIIGPESFTNDTLGNLYTGSADGKIWQISSTGEARVIARTGKNLTGCGGSFELEPVCGRPKGMGYHPDGHLYVVDCYKGLLRVNITTGEMEVLATEVTGIPFRFLNGLIISSTGIIYFTDSSSKWDRRNYRYEVIETNHLGRLIEYDPSVGKPRLLLDSLYLANGVALSKDESFLIFSEMSICTITKYFLKGPRAGEHEVFQSNLPGYPDNIRLSRRGTFYVGLASVRFEGSSPIGSFLDIVGPYPAIKRFIAKVTPFFAYQVFLPPHAILLEFDSDGTIIRSFHDPEGASIRTGVSEAFELGDYIYLGHFSSPFLGVLRQDDLTSES